MCHGTNVIVAAATAAEAHSTPTFFDDFFLADIALTAEGFHSPDDLIAYNTTISITETHNRIATEGKVLFSLKIIKR